ncbi:ubiquitin-specific protease ubp1 [Paramarasmius palmivorus]|uniref:Ubiquitin-specific protease ubp1 n=1 Tax=Paramarasmius palmivorus TaxID=297713 RepID=A0AAW0BSB0_9AGAR
MLLLKRLFLPVLFALRACSQTPESRGSFVSPRTGIKWRYWLQDGSADLDVIRSDVAEIARVGSSGLEWLSYQSYGGLQFNTGLTVVDPTDVAFGSDRFITVTSAMVRAAVEHGLTIDLALGPNQGAGVPVQPDDVDREGMLTELVFGHLFLGPGESFNGSLTSSQHPPICCLQFLGAQLVDPAQITEARVPLDYTTLIDLTDKVEGEEGGYSISWAPESNATNVLLAYYYRRNGNPHAVGGFNGPQPDKPGSWGAFVVDHWSPSGVNVTSDFFEQYILSKDGIGELLAQPGVGKYMWEDSLEFQGQVWWTDKLPQKFTDRHGYIVNPVLPILHTIGIGRQWPLNQTFIWSDMNITQAFLEDYRDVTFSNQPTYGFDMDAGASASGADVPEIESLGIPTADQARQLSGGVHLANQLLQDCKDQYAAGVNLAVLHGYAYSGEYPNTTWPGLTTFSNNFADMHGPRMPAWDHYKEYLDFLARSQYVLQSGTAKVDVAIYRKAYNISTTPPFQDDSLQRAGYTYEYVSPESLKIPSVSAVNGRLAPEGPAYKALVLNHERNTTIDAAQRFVDYAENGLPIILVDLVPDGIPGFDVDGTRSAEVQSLMDKLVTLPSVRVVEGEAAVLGTLASMGVIPSASIDPPSLSFYSVRRDDGPSTSHFFLYNRGSSPINGTVTLVPGFEGTPFVLDPWAGRVDPVFVWDATADGIVIPGVSLAANQSLLLTVTSEATFEGVSVPPAHIISTESNVFTTSISSQSSSVAYSRVAKHARSTSRSKGESVRELDGWQLNITKWTSPEDLSRVKSVLVPMPPINLTDGLVPWDQLEGYADTSGVGTYVTTFEWDHTRDGPVGAKLDFGVVVHTLKAWLNGVQITTADPTHPVVDISEYLIQGTNIIRVDAASTLLNVVNSAPKVETLGEVRILHNPPVPNQHYGLVEPVRLIPFARSVIEL